MYGDVYLNTLYFGMADRAGEDGLLDDFSNCYTFDEITDDIGTDDL